ncbi:winged helix-turn-helix domain-containing tetratricopeptide repeat protein [Chachezhania antarctica]|uniref:winged helix-turn-helix domain-containing tetratricopeptide repeat protein n=1 Tax=Chachezhania antarctica TaxID=2340860 RepID=UPI0013CE6EF4|nr:winged helix-turn-helix domain-containing protein [Chachezhania antarctica]
MKVQFRDCVLESDLARVERGGHVRSLTPQTLRILDHLIRNRHRVVGKDELIAKVWGDRIISDASLSTAIKEVRQAIGDNGRTQHTIKTMHGHGFRFVADVNADAEPQEARSGIIRDSRPSIAVLPFRVLGATPEDGFIADGLTEQTIVNLSRFRDLFVFSRRTTTQMAEDGARPGELRLDPGVDYLVEGSVRRASPRLRVTVQVSATASGELLLTEQFDRDDSIDGLIDIQDELARLIAGRVASRYGAVADHIGRVPRAGGTHSWDTYRLLTQFHDYYVGYDPEIHATLRDAFPRALEKDPQSSQGWSAYAMILLEEYRYYMNARPDVDALALAHDAARQAVRADPQDAFAQTALALCRFYRKDLPGFRDAAERALDLNDGHADVLAEIGHCFAFIGEEERAIALLDRAIAVSPVHPGWYHFAHCWRLANAGRFEDALVEINRFPMPGFFWYHAHAAWFEVELGHMSAAREEAAAMLALYPTFEERAHAELSVDCYDTLRDRALAAWRKAGLTIRPAEQGAAAMPAAGK